MSSNMFKKVKTYNKTKPPDTFGAGDLERYTA